ncbi:hypothetical protein [Sulfuricurvum sp.]|uniref:hypothetical protein n=1 Tax=Sulfuricurvum sp. TaxID=2025608 RepID=UPI002734660D|nr:hypothetical protein [Sulfuricurvum sp.]
MMLGIEKYDNLKDVIPNLMPVLRDAIQSEFLEIKKINKECEKYIASCNHFPELTKAEYVIFSQHIKKNEHKYEMFVFIDAEGNMVRHVTGAEMELYGLLDSCANLHVSEEYVEQQTHCHDGECRH